MPHASTAFHVLVTVGAHAVPALTSPPTWFTVAPLHASVAVGAVNDGDAVHSIVAFAPAFPIVGACVSTNVIVWLRVTDVLPHASTAFHVLVTVGAHAVPALTSPPTWFTVAPLHASVAVGAVNDGDAVHSIVAFAPAFPIVGACVSTNVIVWLRVTDVLGHASTGFHVLVTVGVHALAGLTSPPTWFTVAPLHASVAVGAVNDGDAVHSIVAFTPPLPIIHSCVSTTVFFLLSVTDLLPHASTAFHVLVTVGAHAVPALTSPLFLMIGPPPRSTLFLYAMLFRSAVHSIVAFAPAFPIVGACVSTNVIVWLRVTDVLPHASTAFHVLVTVGAHAVPALTSPPTWFTVAPLHASVAVGAVNDGDAVHSIVAFAAAFPIVGACVSTNVIVWLRVTDVLPHASTAFHVLVTVGAHAVPALTSPPTWFTVAPLHASVAVGAVNDGDAVHSIVAFAPAFPIVRACVATNVIVWQSGRAHVSNAVTSAYRLATAASHDVHALTSPTTWL